jgi:hypothetical protein
MPNIRRRTLLPLLSCAAVLLGVTASQAEAPAAAGNRQFSGTHSLFVALATPANGKEAEFNAWYDKHLQQLLALPIFVRGQRYGISSSPERSGPPGSVKIFNLDPAFKYAAVYEMTVDTETAMKALGKAMGPGGSVAPPDPAIVAGLMTYVLAPNPH